MYKDLSHLTPDEQLNIAKRYYNGENVNNLIEELNLGIPNSQFYKLLPEVKYEEDVCPYCGGTLMIPTHSKSAYEDSIKISIYCKECGHQPFFSRCQCERCNAERHEKYLREKRIKEFKEQIKREKIIELCGGAQEKIALDSLSLRDRIYLGAFAKFAFSEEHMYFEPLDEIERAYPFTPTIKYQSEIVSALHDARAIVVNPESKLDAFDDDCRTFNLYKVSYLINVKDDTAEDDNALLKRIYNVDVNESLYEIEKKIIIEECVEFLLYILEKCKIRGSFNPGVKTYNLMESLVEEFPESEILSIIYSASSGALHYKAEHGVYNKQVANSMIGIIERYAAKRKMEGWNSKFTRNYNLPQSEISSFVFNSIQKKGDEYFDELLIEDKVKEV